MKFKITRFEENDGKVFICLNSEDTPTYVEHFFTEEEKLDHTGTIERLTAKLQILNDAYVAPTPAVSLMDSIKDISLNQENILAIKEELLAKVEEVAPTDTLTTEVTPTLETI